MSVQNVTNIVSKAVTDHASGIAVQQAESGAEGLRLDAGGNKGPQGDLGEEFDKIATQLEEKISSQVVGGASHAQATGQALKQLNLGSWAPWPTATERENRPLEAAVTHSASRESADVPPGSPHVQTSRARRCVKPSPNP